MLGLAGTLAAGFLASAVVAEVVVGLVAAGLGLGRLVATPGKAGALEEVVGVVALLFTAFPVALLGRLKSADGDFAVVFLASAGFASVLMDVGLFGGEVAVFFAAVAVATGDAAVVLGATGLLLTVVLEVADVGGFESEVRLSVVFASTTFGLVSFGARVEGRVVLVAGRLVVVAEVGPAVGLVGFLFRPGVAEGGRLGLVADTLTNL